MPWLALAADDIRSRLSRRELEALREADAAPEQDDPLGEVLDQAMDEVRGYCAAQVSGAALGPAGTVPPQLTAATLAIVRHRLATRLPVRNLLTEERQAEYRDALSSLRDVAAGRLVIQGHETGGPGGPGRPAITPRPHPSLP